jgi:hypothetical protein
MEQRLLLLAQASPMLAVVAVVIMDLVNLLLVLLVVQVAVVKAVHHQTSQARRELPILVAAAAAV